MKSYTEKDYCGEDIPREVEAALTEDELLAEIFQQHLGNDEYRRLIERMLLPAFE